MPGRMQGEAHDEVAKKEGDMKLGKRDYAGGLSVGYNRHSNEINTFLRQRLDALSIPPTSISEL
jgi:hypothetical protein